MKFICQKWILFAVLIIGSSSRGQPLSDREKAYLAQKGEIVFVANPGQAPFDFVHNKHVTGMNVELAQWMAADLGFKIRIETAPLEQALQMIRSGEADVMTSLFYSHTLDTEFDFSNTLKITPVTVYVHSDRNDLYSLDSLNNRKIAIVASGQAIEVLQQRSIRAKIKFVSTTKESVDLLLNGEVDAIIGNDLIIQHYMYSSGKSSLKMIGDPLYSAKLCMAVRDGEDQLLELINKGISHAQKVGTLNRTQAKWLGSEYARRSLPLRNILTIVAAASVLLALMIALIFLWNRKLKRKVDERTRQYRESEDRLRQIFENSPDAVFVLDAEGHIISANDRACASVKMNKQQLLSKRVHDLAPKEFRSEVDENMRLWFSGNLKQKEGFLQDSTGKNCPIEMTGALQKMDGRDVLQLHARDITLRKEAEEKLRAAKTLAEEARMMAEEAREMAENSSQAKSEFLANMSHEIRTPLNGIVGMAQLMCDTPLNGEQNTCLDTILQSTNGLLNIINHVLDISKIEAGQMDVLDTTMDLRDMCHSLYYMFQPQAERSGIKLRCECQDNVPLYVIGDEGLIEQVLMNLLGNAMKFTHSGSVTLNIECRQKSVRGAEIYFQVIDTGIGISKEKQPAVFDKFMQADSSAKRLYGGTGLGLAICKQLIELMGGKIGLISSFGQGSTFFFNLTMKQASHPAAIKGVESKPKTVKNPGTKVLLVEDNVINQKVATAILRKAGCQVDTADNGQDAIQRVRAEKYDAVLMDCQMPVMDGFEATSIIRRMDKPLCDIPIIAITAHAMKDDKQKCIDGGMNDYISKPVSRQALVDLISKHT